MNKGSEASIPPYAKTAFDLTVTDWNQLGLDTYDENLSDAELLTVLVDRVTSLLLIRIVAFLLSRDADEYFDAPAFSDLSVTTICRAVLQDNKPWSDLAPEITDEFLEQLKSFVRTILLGYKDTPYHCKEHAFHVVLSVNKLTDLMIQSNPKRTKTFGLRFDAMAHLALIFSALIHDVEHTGVPNRQLVAENDPLAILYNDQSVAEQRSLYIAFETLLRSEHRLLLTTLFPFQNGKLDSIEYRRFRKMVIGLVLCTDIASPERSQLTKSKWKEAFGETFESIERKLKHELNATVADNESVSASETPDSSENNDPDDGCAIGSGDSVSIDLKKYLANNDLGYENPDDLDGVIMSGTTRSPAKGLENMPGSIRSITKSSFRVENMSVPVPEVKSSAVSVEGVNENERFRRGGRRRSHAHSMPMGRRNSVQQLLQSDDYVKAKFQRRMSSYTITKNVGNGVRPENFRKRLGLRRSMDLGGEEIEFYNSMNSIVSKCDPLIEDEPDELRASVVMETIMTAADVAHNLQGWDQMVIWSGRLYLELRKAFIDERGIDPETRWYENQIGFLESYLLPLARRLEDTGVFGDIVGQMFATIVEANRDQWIQEGQDVTEAIVEKGAEEYKVGLSNESVTEITILNGKGGRSIPTGQLVATAILVILFQFIAIPGIN